MLKEPAVLAAQTQSIIKEIPDKLMGAPELTGLVLIELGKLGGGKQIVRFKAQHLLPQADGLIPSAAPLVDQGKDFSGLPCNTCLL